MFRHTRSGFTLIELLIVMVVIAILFIVGLFLFNNIKERGEETKVRAEVRAALVKANSGYVNNQNTYGATDAAALAQMPAGEGLTYLIVAADLDTPGEIYVQLDGAGAEADLPTGSTFNGTVGQQITLCGIAPSGKVYCARSNPKDGLLVNGHVDGSNTTMLVAEQGAAYSWGNNIEDATCNLPTTDAPAGACASGAPFWPGGKDKNTTITLTSTPAATTSSTTATFQFEISGSIPSAVQCRIDGGSWTNCTSPQTYNSLSVGAHTFEVRTQGGQGADTSESYDWTITAPIVCDSVAPQTNKVVFSRQVGSYYNIISMNPDGSGVQTVASTTANLQYATLSPDGTKVAYKNASTLNVMITCIDGSATYNTNTRNSENTVSWSPDSSRITFASNLTGGFVRVHVMQLTAAFPRTEVTTATGASDQDFQPVFDSTGDYVYYRGNNGGLGQDIYRVASDGSGNGVGNNISNRAGDDVAPIVTDSYVFWIAGSGAGTGTGYRSDLDGSNQTAVTPTNHFASGNTHVSVNAAQTKIGWRISGAYSVTSDRNDIYTANMDGSSMTKVMEGSTFYPGNVTWSGSTYLVFHGGASGNRINRVDATGGLASPTQIGGGTTTEILPNTNNRFHAQF